MPAGDVRDEGLQSQVATMISKADFHRPWQPGEEATPAHAWGSQHLGLCTGSFLPCLQQLLLSPSMLPFSIQLRDYHFWEAQLWGWVGCLAQNFRSAVWILVSQHLPCSTTIVDWAVLSTDHRSLKGEDHVSTMVLLHPLGLEPSLIFQMDKWMKELLCATAASLGRRWFCLQNDFFYFCGCPTSWGICRELECLRFRNATGGVVLCWLSKYCPPNLFSFLFTSLNHCCPSIDNSSMLDLCFRWMFDKSRSQGRCTGSWSGLKRQWETGKEAELDRALIDMKLASCDGYMFPQKSRHIAL